MWKTRVLTIFLLLTFLTNSPVLAVNPVAPIPVSQVPVTASAEAKAVDSRAVILQAYLEKYNSPLKYHAHDFIEAADTYNLDWKLVPAIAGVESTFGKFTPGNQMYPSYNAWGWGVYGTQQLHFRSWRDGIFTVSAGLRKNYLDKGLTNPYLMNRVYAASASWGWKVDYFTKDMEKFVTENYQVEPVVLDMNKENLEQAVLYDRYPFVRVKASAPSAALALK